jgi:hypothetical protein
LFLFQHPNGLKEGVGRVNAGRFAVNVCLAKSLHQIRYGGNGKGKTVADTSGQPWDEDEVKDMLGPNLDEGSSDSGT